MNGEKVKRIELNHGYVLIVAYDYNKFNELDFFEIDLMKDGKFIKTIS